MTVILTYSYIMKIPNYDIDKKQNKKEYIEYIASTCLLREMVRSITTTWNPKQCKRCVPKQKLLNTMKALAC